MLTRAERTFVLSSAPRILGNPMDASTPIMTITMISSIVVNPSLRMPLPPVWAESLHVACLDATHCCTVCYVSRRGWPVLQNAARVQVVALLQAVAVHLVKQRPEAHAQPLRRCAAVAASRLERGLDDPALRRFDRVSESTAPGSLLLGGAASRERFPAEIVRLQDRLIRQHRCALDRVLQLPPVPRPLRLRSGRSAGRGVAPTARRSGAPGVGCLHAARRVGATPP